MSWVRPNTTKFGHRLFLGGQRYKSLNGVLSISRKAEQEQRSFAFSLEDDKLRFATSCGLKIFLRHPGAPNCENRLTHPAPYLYERCCALVEEEKSFSVQWVGIALTRISDCY